MAHDFAQPTCPRCGYDLRGAVATWEDAGACPLDGTCTECGLTFCWADVFDPTREEPQWCVEYAPGRPWPMAQAMVGTFARSWLPWVFWRRLRLHHEVRLRRIAVYLLALLILPVAIVYVATQAATAVYVRAKFASLCSDDWVESSLEWHAAAIERWLTHERLEDAPDEARSAALWSSYYREDGPPDDKEHAAMINGLTQESWEPLWRARLEEIEESDAEVRRWKENPPQIRLSYAVAAVEAIFLPFCGASFGYIEYSGETEPYPAPIALHKELPGWYWWMDDLGDVSKDAADHLAPLLIWFISLAVYPLAFALLPITRRRAKVRWRHLARAGLYSMVIPIAILHVALVTLGASWFIDEGHVYWSEWALPISGLAPLPFALVWWYVAIRVHLRLPHPLLVTIVLAVLTPLAVHAGLLVPFYMIEFLSR